MSLQILQCPPRLIGASPSDLLVIVTILVILPASLNDQSKLFSLLSIIHLRAKQLFNKNQICIQGDIFVDCVYNPLCIFCFHRCVFYTNSLEELLKSRVGYTL